MWGIFAILIQWYSGQSGPGYFAAHNLIPHLHAKHEDTRQQKRLDNGAFAETLVDVLLQ